MSLNFILFVLIGLTVSQSVHTLPNDRLKFFKNEIKSNANNTLNLTNQGGRDKRLEASEDDTGSSKLGNCSSVHVNSSNSDNSTLLNCSAIHGNPVTETTDILTGGGPKWLDNIKSGALQRTGFVVLGIMSVLLFFFVIRAIRIRQKKSKSRKYGVIASTASAVEMEPLERGGIEEDEEETTLFDAQQKFRIK